MLLPARFPRSIDIDPVFPELPEPPVTVDPELEEDAAPELAWLGVVIDGAVIDGIVTGAIVGGVVTGAPAAPAGAELAAIDASAPSTPSASTVLTATRRNVRFLLLELVVTVP